MANAYTIRQLYRPVQPAVQQEGAGVTYSEILPAGALQQMIYCYWELKTLEQLKTPFVYRVVADGCIDIFFEPGNPAESFVMGFCKKYTEFPLSNTFHYAGIRFFPAVFPALFNTAASTLSNRFERLELVVKSASAFISSSFSASDSLPEIKNKADRYFTRLLQKQPALPDARFLEALDVILKNSGVVNVQHGLQTGLSPRQLRRYFEFYVGDTPKTFSQVVRFQNILNAKPSKQSLRQNKLFFDSGYYDQAHFIREFKNFYGVTPARAFGQ